MNVRNPALSLLLVGGLALVASGCLAAGATVSHRPAPTVHHAPAKKAAGYRHAGRFEYRQVVQVETGRRWRRHFVDLDIRTQYRRRIRRAGHQRTEVDLRIEAIHLYANGRYLGSVHHIPGSLSRVEATVDRRGHIRLNRDVLLIGSPDVGFELIATRHYNGFLYDHYRPGHGMKVGSLDLWRERVYPERRSELFRHARFDGLVPISLLPDDVHFYDRYDWAPRYGPSVVYGGSVHVGREHKNKPHHRPAPSKKPRYNPPSRRDRDYRDDDRGTARRGTVGRGAKGRSAEGRVAERDSDDRSTARRGTATRSRTDTGRRGEAKKDAAEGDTDWRDRGSTSWRDTDEEGRTTVERNQPAEERIPEQRRSGTVRGDTPQRETVDRRERDGARMIERTYETRDGGRVTVKRNVEFRRLDDEEDRTSEDPDND